MTDKPNPFADMLRDTMRTIREETARKVRQREFRERMTPEQFARVEAALKQFTDAIDPLCGDAGEEE